MHPDWSHAVDWITDKVAIGNYAEAQDAELLKEHAFCSIVSLDGTLSPGRAAEFGLAEVVSYRLIDGPGNDLRVIQYASTTCTDSFAIMPRCWFIATPVGVGRSPLSLVT